MSPLYTTLIYNQGHLPAFPTNPDHPRPLISCITLTTRPLILDAVGAALSLLWLGESPRNIRAEFRSEGTDSEEVSKLPLEEVEVSKQSLEGVSDKGSEWRECAVVLGTVGRGSEWEVLWSVSGTQRRSESKECQRCLRSELEKLRDVFGVENRSSPDTCVLTLRHRSLVVTTWY